MAHDVERIFPAGCSFQRNLRDKIKRETKSQAASEIAITAVKRVMNPLKFIKDVDGISRRNLAALQQLPFTGRLPEVVLPSKITERGILLRDFADSCMQCDGGRKPGTGFDNCSLINQIVAAFPDPVINVSTREYPYE